MMVGCFRKAALLFVQVLQLADVQALTILGLRFLN